MGKPSIFSKDYQKKMRRRKIKFTLLGIAVIFIVIAGVAAFRGQLTGNTKKPVSKSAQNTESQKAEAPKQEQKPNVKEEGFGFKLSDGKELKAVYEVNGTSKIFKYVAPKESNVYYNINPSGNKMVVFDKASQNIMLIDINGNITDITNPSYTSSTGSVITKQAVLAQNSGYIWCDTPMFLNDSSIAYISQLPWLNKTTKYVWIVNADSKENINVRNISGENIKFEALESKGLKITADNIVLYLLPDGGVSQ